MFLSGQLAIYKQDVAELIQEVVNNTMGYDDVNLAREKIKEWLKLIVMIKSGSENAESVESVNIADQTLYLNIISSACIDRSERGVQKIQNLVCHDIFSVYG